MNILLFPNTRSAIFFLQEGLQSNSVPIDVDLRSIECQNATRLLKT